MFSDAMGLRQSELLIAFPSQITLFHKSACLHLNMGLVYSASLFAQIVSQIMQTSSVTMNNSMSV